MCTCEIDRIAGKGGVFRSFDIFKKAVIIVSNRMQTVYSDV